MTKLSVIGLGKLGACTAACFASKGYEVISIDINKDLVDRINKGIAPIREPKLHELISASKERLRATRDYGQAIKQSDITFLIVPTPSTQDGSFSDEYLQDVLKNLAFWLKKIEKGCHLFVITSTVSPGTTEKKLIPLIESISGKKLNGGFQVCYNPEFIALGSVIKDFLNPDVVLIGQSCKSAGDKLETIYRSVCENTPHITRMSIISAEIAKIGLNSYVTMKISFANTLANICEKVAGADIDDITGALGADKRIGPYYLKGGPSYGGPCFPRDNRAFAAFAQVYGTKAMLATATDAVNRALTKHLAQRVIQSASLSNKGTVAVLGLSYKPNTPVIEESSGIKLIDELLNNNMQVVAYDPLAMENARTYFGDKIVYSSSVKDCFKRANVCVITTQADEFKSIDESYVVYNPTTIIDCWRMLHPSALGNKVQYVPLGKSPESMKSSTAIPVREFWNKGSSTFRQPTIRSGTGTNLANEK